MKQASCNARQQSGGLNLANALQLLFEGCIRVFALEIEGVLAVSEHDMHDDTQGPDIYALGVLFAVGHFRSHEGEGATILIVVVSYLILLAQPEIDELDRTQIVDVLNKDVLRLQISVNDALGVDVLHASQNTLHKLGCLFVREFLLAGELVFEVLLKTPSG
eukprot:CAMPEP_0170482808 /NCGR_PEP_ID=MMETSP0208-20121228/2660_1 /TAXON_ID=197538 /ORGANISM="Strombidium inclinatum, Strain S3" /LENGTH=161 /DNA_ID=CAMNT_0010755679 /DNA_START=1519 /DNA_END=2004 /DNA_ORIENTATION=-